MEIEVEVGLTTSDEESSAPLVRRSSKTKSVINFGENGSNRTMKRESEINRDSVADSKSTIEENEDNCALMTTTEKEDKLSMVMVCDVGVSEKKLVENAEERMDGEEFEVANLKVTKRAEITRFGETVNSKSIYMEPANASELMSMPLDSQHSKAALETSTFFVEEEGSESTEILERGGTSLDYESEKTEFMKSEKVIQAMTEIKKNLSEKRGKGKNVCLDTHVFSDTRSTIIVRNGDHTINKEEEKEKNGEFKQHQHGNSVSESARQNSHSSALNEQDERQLKERWTRILEKSEFEGNVEAIVKILKDQESYDLYCPVCSSCITKRVILRKRKRVQKEATDDMQRNVSEGEHDITEIQNDRAEISNEDSEDIEAYGCLACFSLFFRRGVKLFARKSDSAKSQSGSPLPIEAIVGEIDRVSSSRLSEQYPPEVQSTQFIDREKESFHCLPFLYPWRQSNNKASSSFAIQEFSSTMTSQSTSSMAMKGKRELPRPVKEDSGIVDDEIRQAVGKNKLLNEVAPEKQREKQHLYHEDVKGMEDQRPELHFNEEEKQLKMLPGEIDASINEGGIRPHLGSQDQVLTNSSKALGVRQLPTPEIEAEILKGMGPLRQGESYSKDKSRSRIPVSFPAVWSKWATKKRHTDEQLKEPLLPKVGDETSGKVLPEALKDEQLKEPLLPKVGDEIRGKVLPEALKDEQLKEPILPKVGDETPDKVLPEALKDEQLKEPLLPKVGDETSDKVLPEALKDNCEQVISPLKSGGAGSNCLETQDSAGLAQGKVDDRFPSVSDTIQNSEKKVLPSHAAVETVIDVKETSDPQPSNLTTVASEPVNTGSQVQDASVATEWDLLKSIVYGGLTVSITSLGVVSSAAGGDAKKLTVIVIGLANLVSGLFLLFNNILDLNHYHQQQFIETVGHNFWFNGFVAIFSFLVFGSLAPVTYGFSFQKSDDKLYKFLGASIVSLVSIILLSLGKARVTKKSYFRVMTLYIVTGFWASFIGFFAGEYIKKLLEKWGV